MDSQGCTKDGTAEGPDSIEDPIIDYINKTRGHRAYMGEYRSDMNRVFARTNVSHALNVVAAYNASYASKQEDCVEALNLQKKRIRWAVEIAVNSGKDYAAKYDKMPVTFEEADFTPKGRSSSLRTANTLLDRSENTDEAPYEQAIRGIFMAAYSCMRSTNPMAAFSIIWTLCDSYLGLIMKGKR